jgi:hypothetical protein
VTPFPPGTPVKVTFNGQIYFGRVVSFDDDAYQVRFDGDGPLEWYPASSVEEAE